MNLFIYSTTKTTTTRIDIEKNKRNKIAKKGGESDDPYCLDLIQKRFDYIDPK